MAKDKVDDLKQTKEIVQNTIENLHESEAILNTPHLSDQDRAAIREKNKRREETINLLTGGIKEESDNRYE